MTLAARLGVILLGVASTAACDSCARVAEPEPQGPPKGAIAASAAPQTRPRTTTPAVVARMPHDPRAFTQGLLFAGGAFFESTGQYGESSLRRVDPETGRVVRKVALSPQVFGEGLALFHGELFQITWREGRCFVYDATTLEKRRELTYEGEGWGLTNDGGSLLVMSDGTPVLRFVDPASFRVVREVRVHDGERPVQQLNELEWVKGEILANLWGASTIARIDPESGAVVGYLDLSGLPEPHHDDPDAVLNGIAYDAERDRLFVTGKRWGLVFEVR